MLFFFNNFNKRILAFSFISDVNSSLLVLHIVKLQTRSHCDLLCDLLHYKACFGHAGIGAMTWSPLACGIISGKYTAGIPPCSRASLKVKLSPTSHYVILLCHIPQTIHINKNIQTAVMVMTMQLTY